MKGAIKDTPGRWKKHFPGGRGLDWVGRRPPPDGQTHRARPSLRHVIGLDDSRLSGHKAYRTADGPRTPRRHTREGDAAIPVCVWAHALVCVVHALVCVVHAWHGAARHVGSHGWAAPGPVMVW